MQHGTVAANNHGNINKLVEGAILVVDAFPVYFGGGRAAKKDAEALAFHHCAHLLQDWRNTTVAELAKQTNSGNIHFKFK